MKQEGKILKCKVIAKTSRGKVPLLMVDAGLKKEAFVRCDEFEKEPNIGDEIELFLVEKEGGEIFLSYTKLIEHKKMLELLELKKRNRKITVTPGLFGKEVIWQSSFGALRGSILSNKITDKKEVIILKVLPNSFLCVEEKSLKPGAIVNCKVISSNEFFAFVEIIGFPKFEGLIGINDIKRSNVTLETGKQIKVKVIHIEGTKVTLSAKEIRDVELKKNITDFLEKKLDLQDKNIIFDKNKTPAEISCKIKSIDNEGAHCEINNFITGFCSLNNLSWTYNSFHDVNSIFTLKPGDMTKFIITDCIVYGDINNENKCFINAVYKLSLLDKIMTVVKDNGKDFECLCLNEPLYFKKISYFSLEPDSNINFKIESIKLILSYKENIENPYINFERHHRVGDKVVATITSDPFNNEIFAEVSGVSCVLPQSEISWQFQTSRDEFNKLKKGAKITCCIKSINVKKCLVILSLKKIKDDLFNKNVKKLQKNEIYHCVVVQIITINKETQRVIKGVKVSFKDPELAGVFGFIPRDQFGNQKLFINTAVTAKLVSITGKDILLSKKDADNVEDDKILAGINNANVDGNSSFIDFLD